MLTIVIDSFDGYSDLWPCFFEVFKKHWVDCPYKVKLVSNENTYAGVDTICVGPETVWSERTEKAIRQIDTEFVLLLLEDYLFGEPVKTQKVADALRFLMEKNGKYLRLTNYPKSRFSDGELYFPLYEDEEYGVNLQAAIWRKDFLLESLRRFPGNAWEFEIGFLKSAVVAEHHVLADCYGMSEDPLHVHNGVLKGKWFPKEIRYFSNIGIVIPWQARGKLSPVQVVKYQLAVGVKARLSNKTRKKVKSILRKLGMRFVSDL